MRNLEQIRAKSAYDFISNSDAITGSDGGNILSKLPSMIVADGLLATAAFAKVKKGGYEKTVENIFEHLKSQDICDGMTDLARKDAVSLQWATTEALAYASFLKRFGRAKRNEASHESED